jgi:hypothetical protein
MVEYVTRQTQGRVAIILCPEPTTYALTHGACFANPHGKVVIGANGVAGTNGTARRR